MATIRRRRRHETRGIRFKHVKKQLSPSPVRPPLPPSLTPPPEREIEGMERRGKGGERSEEGGGGRRRERK